MSDKRVVHSGDLTWTEESVGAFFASRRRRLSDAAGGASLTCDMLELAPGKTAAPFRFHLLRERAIYVLSGVGTLRRADGSARVQAGDYVALVAGPDGAAQLTNTGADPLRYLMIAAGAAPDVVVYPDSDKVGVEGDPHGGADMYFESSAAVARWHGEPVGAVDGEADAAADVPGSNPGEKTRAQQAQRREDEREAQIDAEIEAMKRRMGERPPVSSTPRPDETGPSTDSDDIDALKAKLGVD